MQRQTLNLGQYKLSIPAQWRLNGQKNDIEEQIKNIFKEADLFEKTTLPSHGLKFKRFFTKEGLDPFKTVQWEKRDCKITNPDGSTIFEMKNIEVPSTFSQIAGDVIISKYFRKAGVPQYDEKGNQILNENGSPKLGPEQSVKQVINRLTNCWRYWGAKYNYFNSKEDAQIFEDELKYTLLHQMAAPNSPQWFNTGIALSYNIKGKPQGHYYVDPDTGTLLRSKDAYTRPQPHACFIQSAKDDLVNPGGIMDLWMREARIFKYGSGTGTNFSSIRGRGEPLSGGGTSSGLLSFLKIGDKAAGAIKSGGTTRRAAKMVCLDIDHPEIEEFINWKAEEEKKVQALVKAGYSADFEGEAYETVSGQNSNNSVRIPNEFMKALENKEPWNLRWRTNGKICKTVPAEKLWDSISKAAWQSADPGIQFHTTINEWHTCPASGPIRASNPCSEYMFLDDSACNLASLNLIKFFDAETRIFNIRAFKYAARLWTVVLEISVLMAQFPSKSIAQNSFDFRSLGLGYANLGSLLMVMGIPYDSDKGRAMAGAITAIMTGQAYVTSAKLARYLGPFPKFEKNKNTMLKVIRNHRRTAYETKESDYEELTIKPISLNPAFCPPYLLRAAQKTWDRALELGEKWGFRNAQTTVIAPTGTIGLLMDCDTTGIEPDFALIKFKKLAGGGTWKIPNQSIAPALKNLGYNNQQINNILEHINKNMTIEGAKDLKEIHLNIFDCANPSSEKGRFIHYMGHVKMLSAVQPFVSGSISKTINLPSNATTEEIKRLYFESWKLGLKAVAIYRDGCKLSQPLSVNSENGNHADSANKQSNKPTGQLTFIERGTKKELPARRNGLTIESTVAGHKIFLRSGEYKDGALGEIFIDMHKEGAAFRSMLNCFAIAVSLGLQYGVPLKKFVDKFTFTRFEPNGPTDHPNIKTSTSIVDFIFRVLGMEYLNRTDFIHIPPDTTAANTANDNGNNQKNKDANFTNLSDFNKTLMGDAPACNECGHITVRNGNCYRCLNCGTSMGCS